MKKLITFFVLINLVLGANAAIKKSVVPLDKMNDKAFVLKTLETDPFSYKDILPGLKEDKEIAKKFIKFANQGRPVTAYLSDSLKKDKEIYLEIVSNGNGYDRPQEDSKYLQTGLEEVWLKDSSFVSALIKQGKLNLEMMPPAFLSYINKDKNLALDFVKRYPKSFAYLSEELRGDYQFIEYLLKNFPLNYPSNMSESFRKNKVYFKKLIEINPIVICLGDPVEIKDDEVIVKNAIRLAPLKGVTLYSDCISERLNKIYGLKQAEYCDDAYTSDCP